MTAILSEKRPDEDGRQQKRRREQHEPGPEARNAQVAQRHSIIKFFPLSIYKKSAVLSKHIHVILHEKQGLRRKLS